MRLFIVTSSKRRIEHVILNVNNSDDNIIVADLKASFLPRLSPHRKVFKFLPKGQSTGSNSTGSSPSEDACDLKVAKAIVLDDDKRTLKSYGISDGSEIEFKDLGPQIGYRTVFFIEYAGPIIIMLLCAMQPSFMYRKALGNASALSTFSFVQKLYIVMFIIHFVKRELETYFIHKFSRPTMPLMNLFKNSIYYWSFAAFISYVLCHPKYTSRLMANSASSLNTSSLFSVPFIAAYAWCLFELCNFIVHYQLSRMRSNGKGDKTRKVPKMSPFFSLVSCPNYTFEVLSWAAFSAGSNIMMSWVFTLLGLVQMIEWAVKKHKAYIKMDPSVKERKAIIPFII